MAQTPDPPRTGPDKPVEQSENPKRPLVLYCPACAREVTDPLTCGDCSAIICRLCGTPLEGADDLAFG